MGVQSDAFFSRGDLMREIAELKRRLDAVETARRLPNASIDGGNLRVKGGSVIILDAAGNETMRLSTDGLTLAGVLSVVGSLDLAGGSIIVRDDNGAEVFRADADGLKLLGLLEVAGDIEVAGGNINLDQDGSFRVLDDAGDVVVQAGLLANGNHGLAALNPADGTLVDLATLAFGIRSAVVASNQSTTSTTYTDLATVGPTISNVPIGSSRRCLVLLSASILATLDGSNTDSRSEMSVEVSGASSISALDNDPSRAFIASNKLPSGDPFGIRLSATSLMLLDSSNGLNAGSNTFRMKYRQRDNGGAAAQFADRKLFVLPF